MCMVSQLQCIVKKKMTKVSEIMCDRVYCGMYRTLEFQHGLLLEREDRIKRIEGDILDVNQIMRELAALVHQQGDTIGKHPLFATK